MKFTSSIEIKKPKDVVARYFADPNLLGEYQDTFISKELISGESGENGARSKMLYKMGKSEMELIETIIENKLPDSFFAEYHHNHMDNTMLCKFKALDVTTTNYISEIEYTAFRGFMPKAMSFLFPNMFKKQVNKWLINFKTFVEAQ